MSFEKSNSWKSFNLFPRHWRNNSLRSQHLHRIHRHWSPMTHHRSLILHDHSFWDVGNLTRSSSVFNNANRSWNWFNHGVLNIWRFIAHIRPPCSHYLSETKKTSWSNQENWLNWLNHGFAIQYCCQFKALSDKVIGVWGCHCHCCSLSQRNTNTTVSNTAQQHTATSIWSQPMHCGQFTSRTDQYLRRHILIVFKIQRYAIALKNPIIYHYKITLPL